MTDNNEILVNKAKDILRLFIDSGSEAYIVGESLRDILLNIETSFIEIYTSLAKDAIKELLSNYVIVEVNNYIEASLLGYKYKIYNGKSFEISAKTKANATKPHYSTSLMSFLEKMDFKVNSLSLGVNDVIYDCFNGRDDLNKKRLKLINNNPNEIFTESPGKILKTIALVSKLGFKLDRNIIHSMARKSKLLKKLSINFIATQMDEIITSKYSKKAINLMIKTKVYKKLPYYKHEIKRLGLKFYKFDKDIFLGACLVREGIYEEAIGRTANDKETFINLVTLAITNPKSEYDILTLYSNGLENCLKANYINHLLYGYKKKTKKITKAFNDLAIKKTCDLAFKGQDIIALSKELDTQLIPGILDNIIYKVLHKEILNEYDDIKNFVIEELKNITVTTENNEIESNRIESNRIESNRINSNRINSIRNECNNSLIEKTSETKYDDSLKKENDLDKDFGQENSKSNISINLEDYHNLSNRVLELEIANLKIVFQKEVDEKIKESGLLNNIEPKLFENTYQTLKKVYTDILINDSKYIKLKGKIDE